jgi:hypothetical protein
VQAKESRCKRRIGIRVSLIRDKRKTTESLHQLTWLSAELEQIDAQGKIEGKPRRAITTVLSKEAVRNDAPGGIDAKKPSWCIQAQNVDRGRIVDPEGIDEQRPSSYTLDPNVGLVKRDDPARTGEKTHKCFPLSVLSPHASSLDPFT